MPRLSHKAKQFLWWTIKIAIVLLASYFIHSRLDNDILSTIQYQILEIDTLSLYLYISILLLTLVNWALECKKWHLLSNHIKQNTVSNSISQTLIAHLSGFITPAKTGDYGAKVLFYVPEQRKKILFLNFIGNMYQMIATIFFGFIGLGIIAFFTDGMAIFFWGLSLFISFILYNLLPKVLRSFNWSLKGNAWHKVKNYWKTIPIKIKKGTLILSFARYIVFAHQFYFLLIILGASISYPFAMAAIGAMYLMSSIIPVMQLLDVVVRGGVAVWIFSWYNVPEEIIIVTVFIMWFSNVVLPLLPGTYFLITSPSPVFKKDASK